MSKSLGNGIDPMDVVQLLRRRRAALDARRPGWDWARTSSSIPTTSRRSFAPGRNFVTKLWNIGRFLLEKVGDAPVTPIDDRAIASRGRTHGSSRALDAAIAACDAALGPAASDHAARPRGRSPLDGRGAHRGHAAQRLRRDRARLRVERAGRLVPRGDQGAPRAGRATTREVGARGARARVRRGAASAAPGRSIRDRSDLAAASVARGGDASRHRGVADGAAPRRAAPQEFELRARRRERAATDPRGVRRAAGQEHRGDRGGVQRHARLRSRAARGSAGDRAPRAHGAARRGHRLRRKRRRTPCWPAASRSWSRSPAWWTSRRSAPGCVASWHRWRNSSRRSKRGWRNENFVSKARPDVVEAERAEARRVDGAPAAAHGQSADVVRRLVALVVCATVSVACANLGTPPGGPERITPPELLSVTPDSGAVNVRPRNVVFQFDVVVSDRGGASGDLDDLFLVSPSDGRPRVRWRRSRIEVRPRRGFRPNTAYSVTLLPGPRRPARQRRLQTGRTVVFSTGPSDPRGTPSPAASSTGWTAGSPPTRSSR